jgi:predicted small secreted protein
MFKRFLCALAAMGFLAAVTGCNTIEGLGQDTKAAGNGIEHSAEKHKGY